MSFKVKCTNCRRIAPNGKEKYTSCYNADCPAYKAKQVLKQMAVARR